MNEKLTINVRAEGQRVALRLHDKAAGYLPWQAAQEAARDLRAQAKVTVGLVFYKFELDGRPVYVDLEPALAERLGAALQACGLLAEEQANAEAIAFDSAILARAGAPFGLSNDPRIQDAARTEAAWNRTIRRSALPGIESAETFGVPSLRLGAAPTKHH